ncbi:UNVERIFIED_CONTAM: hypothetical protein GTU68_013316, partial [Idotea baltica]|nr:hypothetical protein [Idotea baltica]
LGQAIRFLLEYSGLEYDDKRYTNQTDYLKDKFSLGFDFPNLPYYIDGNIKITQSNAILRYIAAKTNTAGKTQEERVKVSMLECEAYDMRKAFAILCYDPKFEEKKGAYLSETLPNKLKQLSTFLGNQKWFVGEDVTYADFFLYEVLDCHLVLCPTCLDNFPKLKNFQTRIESLKPIKEYMESGRFIKYPLNGRGAKFGLE